MSDNKKSLNKCLGQALLFFRKLNQLTLQEAAIICKTNINHISAIETNKRTVTFKFIQILSRGYGFPSSTIIKYAEKLSKGYAIKEYIMKEIRNTIIEIL